MMEDDKKYELTHKVERAQLAAGKAISAIFGTLAAFMLHLRSHERALEGHDDVVDHIKEEFIDLMFSLQVEFITNLSELEDQLDKIRVATTNVSALVSSATQAMLGMSYANQLDALGARYSKGFVKSALARYMLCNAGDILGPSVTSTIAPLVGLIVCGVQGKQAGVVEFGDGELAARFRDNLEPLRGLADICAEQTLALAGPELDALAKKEAELFSIAIERGNTPEAAFDEATKAFRARMTQLISAGL